MVDLLSRGSLSGQRTSAAIALTLDPDGATRLPRLTLDDALFTTGAIRVTTEISYDGGTSWQDLSSHVWEAGAKARDRSSPTCEHSVEVWGADDRPYGPTHARYRVERTRGVPVVGATYEDRSDPSALPPPPRHRSIALVQSAQQKTTGVASIFLNYASNVTAGSMLANGHAQWTTGGGTISTPTDTRSNSYTGISTEISFGVSGQHKMRSFYVLNTSAGSNSVTFAVSTGTADITNHVVEFSGVKTTSALLAAANGGPTTSTSCTTGAVTPSENNCLILAFGSHSGGDTTWTESHTIIREDEGGSRDTPLASQYTVQTTAASATLLWTLGASREWVNQRGIFAAPAAAQNTPELYGRPYGLRGGNQMRQLLAQ